MNILSPTPYRKWFFLGLLVTIIAAWFSVGYHHPDEHFQIMEFANYKLGFSPAAELPWEFAAQCRPALQPFVVYCLSKAFISIGEYNPIYVAFFLRLAMGVLTWWLSCYLITMMLPAFKTEKGKMIFVWCSFFLWFVPYIGVRFSAENMAGLFFFMAVIPIIKIADLPSKTQFLQLVIAGLLLGFCCYLRLQMALAILGLGIWMLFIQQPKWYNWRVLGCSALMAIVLSIMIDHWFYGSWVITPLNYFKVNIIQHKAAEFGISPWWYYFTLFLQTAVVPISIVLLFAFLVGVLRKPMHLFSLICIAFLIGHFLIGHKELRFLFPISYGFIFLAAIGIDRWLQKDRYKNKYRWLFPLVASINIMLLIFRIFAPAQEAMRYFDFIYRYAQNKKTTLIAFENSPYKLVGIEANFYKPKQLAIQVIHDTAQLASLLQQQNEQTYLFFSPTIKLRTDLSNYKIQRVYCILPDWLLGFNINHWQDRSNIGVIYQIFPKQ